MLDDAALDAISDLLEEAAQARHQVDVAEIAARFDVDPKPVADLWRAMQALGPPLEAPDQIDRYRIETELGRGGMGVVYRAFDTVLEREVALKTMLLDQRSPQRLERFRRELQALGRLDHPNVVRTLSTGEHQGQAFVALQLLEGRSLADRLRSEGPLSVLHALRLCAAVADGLAAAHAAGVLHRDVKPGNVLLTAEGKPVLTDFGLAREVSPQEWSRLSLTGQVLGSPGYWAPEQVGGLPATERTDVYGLGGVLYACLTSVAPTSTSGDPVEVIAAVARGAIRPPSELRPDLPPEVEAFCLACLARDPANRPASASAVAASLRQLAGAPRAQDNRTVVLTLLALSLVLLVGAGTLGVLGSADGSSTPGGGAPADHADPTEPVAQSALEDDVTRGLLVSARECLQRGEHEAGLEAVRSLLERDPDHVLGLLARAELRRTQGAFDLAQADATRAIELDPNEADAWAVRAICMADMRAHQAAIDDATRAIELNPKHVRAYMERAACRARLGDLPGSLDDYGEVIVLDPDNEKARLRRGGSRFMQGDFAGAIQDCTEALAVGDHPKAWEIRAESRLRLQDFAGAEADSTSSIRAHPDCPTPYISRGRARAQLGKLTQAAADLRAGMARMPDPRDPRRNPAAVDLQRVEAALATKRAASAMGLEEGTGRQ
jgi:serine/threonine-protein kinase